MKPYHELDNKDEPDDSLNPETFYHDLNGRIDPDESGEAVEEQTHYGMELNGR
ncbi:MAG: hypothetical protein WKF92_15640 [Pyrinomonadaceae bacterium]